MQSAISSTSLSISGSVPEPRTPRPRDSTSVRPSRRPARVSSCKTGHTARRPGRTKSGLPERCPERISKRLNGSAALDSAGRPRRPAGALAPRGCVVPGLHDELEARIGRRLAGGRARARGLIVHMGRVNSLRRLRYAHTIGCHCRPVLPEPVRPAVSNPDKAVRRSSVDRSDAEPDSAGPRNLSSTQPAVRSVRTRERPRPPRADDPYGSAPTGFESRRLHRVRVPPAPPGSSPAGSTGFESRRLHRVRVPIEYHISTRRAIASAFSHAGVPHRRPPAAYCGWPGGSEPRSTDRVDVGRELIVSRMGDSLGARESPIT
jgi:hypothetical protein